MFKDLDNDKRSVPPPPPHHLINLLLLNDLRFGKIFHPPIHPPISMNSDQKDITFPRDKGGGSKLSTFLMQGIVVSHFIQKKLNLLFPLQPSLSGFPPIDQLNDGAIRL